MLFSRVQMVILLFGMVFSEGARGGYASTGAIQGSINHPGVEGTARLLLDPFNKKNKATFEARYYIDTEYASGPDAPVIYFLGNEGEMFTMIDSAGFMMTMAKELHANFVALEHRYYGKSIPAQFPELTAEALQYLTVKNALADFRAFEHFAKRKFNNLRGKWFTIGRSYGGGLSVWYRETYPNETVGAIAGAPSLHFPRASSHWDQYIVSVMGQACVHDFHAKILDAIEAPYLHGQSMQDWKEKFNAADIKSDPDFLGAIGNISTFVVQMEGPSAICSLVSGQDPTGDFIKTIQTINSKIGMTLSAWTEQGIMDPSASLYEGAGGMRQWPYQVCTEFGDAEIIPSDPSQTIQPTSIAGYETQEQQCMKVFGIHFTADPEHGIDQQYFNPLIAADSKVRNVLITSDTADPTSVLGVPESENQNPGVVVYPVEGAAHHQELSTPTDSDSQALKDAREMILNSARAWLQE